MSTEKPSERFIWGIGAEFESVPALYEAAKRIREAKYSKWDVHSPFPVHGMDSAMGLTNSKVSMFSLIGGACGFTTAVLLIHLTSQGWPTVLKPLGWLLEKFPVVGQPGYQLILNGKPFFAPEYGFPVMFELTILLTAFFTLGSMLVINLLPRLNHPVFNWNRFHRVSTDGLFAVIEARDPRFDREETRRFLEELGGRNVTLIYDDE
jgi:hypothetical protein